MKQSPRRSSVTLEAQGHEKHSTNHCFFISNNWCNNKANTNSERKTSQSVAALLNIHFSHAEDVIFIIIQFRWESRWNTFINFGMFAASTWKLCDFGFNWIFHPVYLLYDISFSIEEGDRGKTTINTDFSFLPAQQIMSRHFHSERWWFRLSQLVTGVRHQSVLSYWVQSPEQTGALYFLCSFLVLKCCSNFKLTSCQVRSWKYTWLRPFHLGQRQQQPWSKVSTSK